MRLYRARVQQRTTSAGLMDIRRGPQEARLLSLLQELSAALPSVARAEANTKEKRNTGRRVTRLI